MTEKMKASIMAGDTAMIAERLELEIDAYGLKFVFRAKMLNNFFYQDKIKFDDYKAEWNAIVDVILDKNNSKDER